LINIFSDSETAAIPNTMKLALVIGVTLAAVLECDARQILRHRHLIENSTTTEPEIADNSTTPVYQKNWWELGLTDEILDEVGLYYLGQAWYQASDIGEVLETMSRVDPNDKWSWSQEFFKTATRMEALGKESADAGEYWISSLSKDHHVAFFLPL
jgi:hypothetical protein